MVIQLDVNKSHMLRSAPPLEMARLKLQYLMIFFYSFPRSAGTGFPVDGSTATVTSTALHEEATGKEDHVGQLQLLS